jgi:peptidoglycan/xylan/chitin deacetylase (PgdA/CDA1 family)
MSPSHDEPQHPTGVGRRLNRYARLAAKSAFATADLVLGPLPGPRVLVYHQVGAGLGRQMEVTTAAFIRHLDWLAAHGRVVTLEEALRRSGEPDSDRLFVLSFDDGYEDFYENAFPMLVSHGFPFLMYLTTAPVETGVALTPGGRANPLTWDQLRRMLDSGIMTAGAHTHTHVDLRGLGSASVADELDKSNELIRHELGVDPRHFAYPWGYWDPRADQEVRRRYATAALGSGRAIGSDTDAHLINRIPIQLDDGHWFFTRKIRTGLRMEDRARRLVTGYRGP